MNIKRNMAKTRKKALKRKYKRKLIFASDGLGIYQMVADSSPMYDQDQATYEKLKLLSGNDSGEYIHCDELICDEKQPLCLRRFLRYKRWPAAYQCKAHRLGIKEPQLFADYGNRRVKVVMASRLGDVGITGDITADCGYDLRVPVEALKNFSEVK